VLLAGMTHENCSTSASTNSHPAPETGNITDRVQALRQNVRDLSETIDAVQKKLLEGEGDTEKNDE
jgi:uncharacterized protein YceH (UPF0502 family)